MTRKRRVFDITPPEDDIADTAPETKSDLPARRGPMASAISENARALQTRTSTTEAIRAENDALAHEYVSHRKAGNIVESIPLENVHTYMLVRDRMPGEDTELESLMTSIRELGLSNPIRVMQRPDGTGVELVQGFRRLSAYKALLAQTGDTQWAAIPALIMAGAADIGGLYRRMVDENVIRKDLSFAEMAHAAQVYAADPGTDAENLGDAVAALFQSAPYSKRSYIKSFAYLLDQIGDHLQFPAEIPRALGVAVARTLKDRPDTKARIRDDLKDWSMRGIRDELDVLRRYTGHGPIEPDGEEDIPGQAKQQKKPTTAARVGPKASFELNTSAGRTKCTASVGKLEIKVDRDFTSIDRAQLERAIAGFLEGLA